MLLALSKKKLKFLIDSYEIHIYKLKIIYTSSKFASLFIVSSWLFFLIFKYFSLIQTFTSNKFHTHLICNFHIKYCRARCLKLCLYLIHLPCLYCYECLCENFRIIRWVFTNYRPNSSIRFFNRFNSIIYSL